MSAYVSWSEDHRQRWDARGVPETSTSEEDVPHFCPQREAPYQTAFRIASKVASLREAVHQTMRKVHDQSEVSQTKVLLQKARQAVTEVHTQAAAWLKLKEDLERISTVEQSNGPPATVVSGQAFYLKAALHEKMQKLQARAEEQFEIAQHTVEEVQSQATDILTLKQAKERMISVEMLLQTLKDGQDGRQSAKKRCLVHKINNEMEKVQAAIVRLTSVHMESEDSDDDTEDAAEDSSLTLGVETSVTVDLYKEVEIQERQTLLHKDCTEAPDLDHSHSRDPTEIEVIMGSGLRVRNTRPLGRLHPDGGFVRKYRSCPLLPRSRAHAAATELAIVWKEAGLGSATSVASSVRCPSQEPKVVQLKESGVDSEAIRAWLGGEISARLCRARVLEAAARGCFSSTPAKREVSRTVDLYTYENGANLGGYLGALVGGLAGLCPLPGLQGSHGRDTDKPWMQICGSDNNASPSHALNCAARSLVTSESGLDAETVNFEFRRQCLQAHPQRQLGGLTPYLQVHCHLEVLRQASVLVDGRGFHHESAGGGSAASAIAAAQIELGRSDSEAKEASSNLGEAELELWNEQVSRYLLDLSWQKDALQAILAHLKASEAYTILGVEPGASEAELTRAYKAAAMKAHPDKGGDAEQFKAIRAAYERILSTQPGKDTKQTSERPPDKSTSKTAGPVSSAGASETSASDDNTEILPEVTQQRAEQSGDGAMAAPSSDDAHTDISSSPQLQESDQGHIDVDGDLPKQEASTFPEHVAAPAHQANDSKRTPEETSLGDVEEPSIHHDEETYPGEPVDLQEVVRSIPVEVISKQAELALNAAEMCIKLARLANEAASQNSWEQLIQCGLHFLDSSHCVTEATQGVARCAVGIPADLLPLLDRFRTINSMPKRAVTTTRDLMRCTEVISERGLKTATLSNRLLEQAVIVADTMQTVATAGEMSHFAHLALAGTLRSLANCARDTADAAAAAAVIVGDAQGHAQALKDMLDKIKQTDCADEDLKKADKDQTADKNEDADTDEGSDNEASDTPHERVTSNRTLLQKLNGEVLDLQKEMRSLVVGNPSLLPEVDSVQKEWIFALVDEIAQQLCRCVKMLGLGIVDGPRDWDEAMKHVLALVNAAADWEGFASPPFEARVLRVAALVDSTLLQRMLRAEVLDYCLALAPDDAVTSTEDAEFQFSESVSLLCRRF